MTKRYVAVAGTIGAGKTSLVRWLEKRYGLRPFFEPHEANPYLEDFYQDMKRWGFSSQLFFLAHKLELHQQLLASKHPAVIDRTIYEDAEIFAKNLHRQRFIDTRDYRTYQALYRSITKALRPPDLMIQLSCPVRTLRKRIQLRGRAMERDIPVAYLRRLNRLYEDWFKRYDLSPVLVLESDQLDWLTDLVKFMHDHGLSRVETRTEEVAAWVAEVEQAVEGLLFSEINSWQTGVNRNVEGRQVRRVLGYYGGAVEYRKRTGDVAAGGYRELKFDEA